MLRSLIFVLLLPVVAFAHDADNLCPAGTEPFGCQPAEPHLQLDDPDFAACHKTYWHHRRELEAVVRDYGACLASIWALETWNYGQATYPVLYPTVLNYWDIIPAHPVVDRAGDLDWCYLSVNTAIRGKAIFAAVAGLCLVDRFAAYGF